MADLKIVLARCRKGIVARDERIQQLEEVLRFYADEENWYGYEHIEGPAVARDALSPSEAPEKEEEDG